LIYKFFQPLTLPCLIFFQTTPQAFDKAQAEQQRKLTENEKNTTPLPKPVNNNDVTQTIPVIETPLSSTYGQSDGPATVAQPVSNLSL